MFLRKKKRGRSLSWKTVLVVIFAFVIFFSGTLILWAVSLRIPDLNTFEERKVRQSTKIYDQTEEVLLFDVHENVQRTLVQYENISRHAKNAAVAIEDAEFYEHRGIKLSSIVRAVLVNIGNVKFSQGGSTITQQVVKNSILTSEKKVSRKLKEWVLALKLEQSLSKEEILELYLNESPYGGNIYGIEEASHSFFDKSASDITLAEAAYLAALPQAPTFYSPHGNNREALEKRKDLVLSKMLEYGFITSDEYEEALAEKVSFQPRSETGILAPHFVIFVREYLEERYGQRAVEERGFRVITTLNYELQKKAEDIVRRNALENKEKFNAENAALIAIDPKTGGILAMVGSRDYFDESIDGNFNVTLAHRQPGSAFKPFVYATAFKKGYTPNTTVFDLETEFSTECDPRGAKLYSEAVCYRPQNYDSVFRGPITLRNALAQSVNVPSVKTLYLSGLQDSLRTARDLGIQSLADINQYGLTLVLGGGEVALLDMVGAYGVFANDGIKNTPVAILRIEDNEGNIVEEFVSRSGRVLDEQIARQISDILSDNDARSPAFGTRSYLYFPERDVAVKTGTTNDYRDAWIVGYTPNVAVGAWAGNNDNSPMEKKVAGFIIAPLWNEFMQEVLQEFPEETFTKPRRQFDEKLKPVLRGFWQGNVSYVVDTISGKLATEFTPEETREERVVKDVHSILYWVDKNNPLGDAPENPALNPQFPRWEYAVRKWVDQNGIVEETESVIPEEQDNVHGPGFTPTLRISNLKNAYQMQERITLTVSGSGRFPLARVDLFVNGAYVGRSSRSPFSFSFIPSETEAVQGTNTIRIIGYDSVFNKGEYGAVFSIN